MPNEKLYYLFGEKIRFFAEKKFGSLTGLAEKLSMSLSDLHRYVSGKVQPKREFFVKMKDLDCNIDWLIDDTLEIEKSIIKEPSLGYAERLKTEQMKTELINLKKQIIKVESLLKEEGGNEEDNYSKSVSSS